MDISVTRIGDVVKITYSNGSNSWVRFSRNTTTDKYVGEYDNGKIGSNLLCDIGSSMTYMASEFNMIDGIAIGNTDTLFTELEKML
ncbi:hypothetical protein KAU11_10730 [Candidatus Babeliales bacterium]|nr:hypothetical protein [Candidatus Babeliales bacterium]